MTTPEVPQYWTPEQVRQILAAMPAGHPWLFAQLIHGPAELGWRPGGVICRTVFEDSVPVGVEGERNAAAPEQSLQQQEVTAGILMIAEEGVDHVARGIVHREQDRELRSVLAQPPVITAIHLDQHPLPGHPLPAHPVLGRAPAPRTAEPGVHQDTPQRGPAHVEALAFTEQLREMGVVGSLVHRASQVNHPVPGRLGNTVGRPAATVAMSKRCSAVFSVIRQYAPGVARVTPISAAAWSSVMCSASRLFRT